jgi:hypothetical protein
MDHDFYTLLSRFWWVIFPLFWMIFALGWGWSRHTRANRALDILKSYADQGKDPPPELMKSLQGGWGGDCGPGPYGWHYGWRYSPQRLLQRAFLFTALAVAFFVLTFWNPDEDNHWHHDHGLLIPMMIFAALAISNFLSLLFMPRGGWPPDDRDRR